MCPSTFELGLTRLWYLVGEWIGSGESTDFNVSAQARFEWALNDRFIAGFVEMRDTGSEQVLSIEHVYIYYDREEGGAVGMFFADDGAVERAVGAIGTIGQLTLLTASLRCVPPTFPRTQLRRSFHMVSKDKWIYKIELDSGHGLQPYITVQMQRKDSTESG
jgi:hypothetical protein